MATEAAMGDKADAQFCMAVNARGRRMRPATDYAFDIPVNLQRASALLIRTVEEALSVVRSNMRSRFTMQGLNTF
jgi:hypothetical protein